MPKILLIEDEAPIREEVLDWLAYEGYQAVGAENGRQGLEIALRERPDLILSDIAMPEMDGHELLIEVRSAPALSDIPFIFLTAAAERNSMRRGMDLGADDYLTKPFTHAEVLNAVRSRLERTSAHSEQVQAKFALMSSALNEERHKRLLKSRLVAMFSHDFRNPLTSILTSIGILKSYEDRLTPKQRHRHIERVEGSVRLLMQMIDDMLALAEIENGSIEFTPQPLDLAGFVGAILDEFLIIDQERHPITFSSRVRSEFKGDPKLLRQIITNLTANALKYSPEGKGVSVTLTETDDAVAITIQDSGIGIPPESLSKIFEPFHRAANSRSVNGTGLGLSIVKDCVERHKGRISVTSEIDQGTTFIVELPRR
ncbi:MAG: ATP-binding protein [Anaerolineae bacterium]|nr:ATP-binding protein [Anaerolineae bacterium]NUQ07027.1 response regulator [Anaerolineae bacterium]